MRDAGLPPGWREAKLGELGSFCRGRGGTKADEDPNGLPCIRYGDLYTHHDCIVRSFASSISSASASSYTRLQRGDVVFAGSGETFEEIGKAAAYCGDAPAYAGADTILFRPGPDLLPQFAGYAVNCESANAHKSRMGQGSSVIHIGSDHLAQMLLKLPPRAQQERIAEILSTADESIEQTKALIAKTHQIKAGLMHDLFTRGVTADGQLRPPREEAPRLYRESSLGWIPKEWDIRPLNGIAEVNRGKFTVRPRNDPRYYNGEYPFIQTGDVALAGGRVLTAYSQTLNSLGLGVSRLFPVGTIMVTIAANIADTCILGISMCAPDSLVGVVPNSGEVTRFIELCIRRRKRWFENRAPQTAQKNINLDDLRPLPIPYPALAEQTRIAERYEAIDAQLRENEQAAGKLSMFKRGLMADLVPGRVPVAASALATTMEVAANV